VSLQATRDFRFYYVRDPALPIVTITRHYPVIDLLVASVRSDDGAGPATYDVERKLPEVLQRRGSGRVHPVNARKGCQNASQPDVIGRQLSRIEHRGHSVQRND
jgi:hypothetical protein